MFNSLIAGPCIKTQHEPSRSHGTPSGPVDAPADATLWEVVPSQNDAPRSPTDQASACAPVGQVRGLIPLQNNLSQRSTALAIEPDPSAVAVVCAAAVAKPQSAAVKTKGLVASADGDGENSPGRAASKFAATVLKLNPQPPGFVATEIQSVRGIAHSIKFS